jgi:hypothetical protein
VELCNFHYILQLPVSDYLKIVTRKWKLIYLVIEFHVRKQIIFYYFRLVRFVIYLNNSKIHTNCQCKQMPHSNFWQRRVKYKKWHFLFNLTTHLLDFEYASSSYVYVLHETPVVQGHNRILGRLELWIFLVGFYPAVE